MSLMNLDLEENSNDTAVALETDKLHEVDGNDIGLMNQSGSRKKRRRSWKPEHSRLSR